MGSREMENSLKQLKKENINWFLYSINGLMVNEQPEFENFIFEDATIVSGSQLKEYFNINNINYNIVDIIPSNLTYIIVQTTGIIKKGNESEHKQKSNRRAQEICSFIFFVFLYLSNYSIGICLNSQIYDIGSMTVYMLKAENKGYSVYQNFSNNEVQTVIPNPPLFYKIEDLLKLFNNNYFKNIFDSVRNIKNNIIKDSLVNLYLTINLPSPMSQLLGAVSSLEIILKDNRKYENIINRVTTLLENEIYNKFEGNVIKKEIFDKRHSIIHDGDNCEGINALKALKLTVNVLINYSCIHSSFINKDTICNVLDILNRIKNNDILKDKNIELFKENRKLKLDFPFKDWLLQYFIQINSLCNTKEKNNFNLEFAKTVEWYLQTRKISIEESYSLINSNMYYNFDFIPKYDEFMEFYNSNIGIIKEEVRELNSIIIVT